MGFPKDIAEQVLLDSGRHCSLCHVFCGTKIELHHIVQAKDGGPDSYENCIPLCFNCHAEVKAYNPKHPKGRSFSESELIGHRDRWYQRVKGGSGTVVASVYIGLDRTTYENILELLPPEGSIYFCRTNNFAGFSFDAEALNELEDFWHFAEVRPDFEFQDPDLEAVRAELVEVVRKCRGIIAMNTFPMHNGRQSVPPELEEENPKRFHEIVNKIHESTTKVCEVYDRLIKLARRKLLAD